MTKKAFCPPASDPLPFELNLTGILQRAIEVEPRYLLDPAVVLESVESTVPGIVAGLAEDADRISTPRHNLIIKPKATDALKPGKQGGRILLNFSPGTVSVPVLGTVKPAFQVVPDRIQLSGKSTKPVERLIMLRSGKAFDVVSSTLENVEGSVEPKRLADGKWQIRLTFDPGSIGAGAVLRLGTSCRQQPGVEVSISVPGAN